MMKLNPGLFVWEETENIFSQIISILWMGQNKNKTNKQIQSQTIDKTMAKPVGVVTNQKKLIIWNKAMNWKQEIALVSLQFVVCVLM